MKRKIAYKILAFSLTLGLLNCGRQKNSCCEPFINFSREVSKIKTNGNNPFLNYGKIQARRGCSLSTNDDGIRSECM
jgi:hypothetical protein